MELAYVHSLTNLIVNSILPQTAYYLTIFESYITYNNFDTVQFLINIFQFVFTQPAIIVFNFRIHE